MWSAVSLSDYAMGRCDWFIVWAGKVESHLYA